MSHILLIDDEQDLLVALGRLLRATGHEVTTVDSGEKAVSLARSNGIDLIIQDLELKSDDLDGMALAYQLKAILAVPLIVISGHDLSEAKAAGMITLQKPFDLVDLLQLVRANLNHKDIVEKKTTPMEKTSISFGGVTVKKKLALKLAAIIVPAILSGVTGTFLVLKSTVERDHQVLLDLLSRVDKQTMEMARITATVDVLKTMVGRPLRRFPDEP